MLLRLFLILLLLFAGQSAGAQAEDPQDGRVVGQVACQAQGACTGVAVLWRLQGTAIPDPRRYTMIPAAVAMLQEDGHFLLSAPAGDYYIGALLRQTPGPAMGPPRVGDLVFLTPSLAGEGVKVSVVAGQQLDIGRQESSWTFAGLEEKLTTGISGQVVNERGEPVSGLLVFAFADPEMTSQPLAVSARTDAQGSFSLPLAEPAEVYLRTRKDYRGGMPEPGDYIGIFGVNQAVALQVEAGQVIEGLKLTVRQIPDLPQRRNAPGTLRPRLEH